MRNTNVKPGELYLFEFWYQSNKRREPYGKIRPVLIMEVKKDKLLLAQVTSQYDKKSDYIKLQYSPIKDWEEAQLLKPSWIDMGQNSLRFVNRHKANLKKIGSLTPEDILRAVNYFGTITKNGNKSSSKNTHSPKNQLEISKRKDRNMADSKIIKFTVSDDTEAKVHQVFKKHNLTPNQAVEMMVHRLILSGMVPPRDEH